ncbi:MAG: beta-propeller fold lactonase family protein [Candidatus Hydrogenedentes bacterium]|nr:beta-propeller fold lactonase family protein [Candidatus Hydrogenedentota bacterium]
MHAFVKAVCFLSVAAAAQQTGPIPEGYLLPNGWRITPVGNVVKTHDLLLNIVNAPDGAALVALHGGYNPHGLVVLDPETDEAVQRIALPSAWFGLAWSTDGTRLYVSGGNNKEEGVRAPLYVFSYEKGRLSEQPIATWQEEIDPKEIYWAGLAVHPSQPLLYAANRPVNHVTVFDTATGAVRQTIAVEETPCDLVLSPDGSTLYCSNWGSDTVSVIDTAAAGVVATIDVGDNPSDLLLTKDGRLFVCCANDNTVRVVDIQKRRVVETIVTSMYPNAPEGSTPNALAVDPDEETLYVANADNYNVCVVDIEEVGESAVLGFIPAGWYPSSVAVGNGGGKLYIGNGKGVASYASPHGPARPNKQPGEVEGTVKSLQEGAITILDVPKNRTKLRELTQQAYANCPYNDDLLAAARPSPGPSVVPAAVGVGSPIKHVLYIIKENRTYDQVFGDLPQGNGDPALTLFGRDVSPNHHALAEQFALLDNIFCDAEVSVDGHQWSNAAYATDYTEKLWPAGYGGHSASPQSPAILPASGYLWDQCARKGLTYRTYGEFAERVSDDGPMGPVNPRLGALGGHVAPNYYSWGSRDYENAAAFMKEFDEYEANYDSVDPEKRLPNFIVMALPEDHTKGTRPGEPTPRACVGSNDYALGLIVERITHSRYWPEIAIFTIEDDAQNGSDHVDARRTISLVISPYTKRGTVDSTLYTTSSILRTIELLLGLQPLSQYDAAATPMYNTLGAQPDLTSYTHLEPTIDIHEMNTQTAWGAEESLKMDFSLYDLAPMMALNEILWKSIKGADSPLPAPIHRFHAAALVEDRP